MKNVCLFPSVLTSAVYVLEGAGFCETIKKKAVGEWLAVLAQ